MRKMGSILGKALADSVIRPPGTSKTQAEQRAQAFLLGIIAVVCCLWTLLGWLDH